MSKAKQKFDLKDEDFTNKKVYSLANRKKFHPHDLVQISPLTKSQENFFGAYWANTPIILQSGAAGTGKTLLAFHCALHEVFDSTTPYQKVVIFRSAVESRKVGFLPGSLEEKAEVYEMPYKSLAKELLKDFNDPYNHLKALGYVQFELTSFQRGVTYDDTIMIIDEVQNMDRSELLTVLSRVGLNSRIILCGDSRQNDLARHREQSAFGYLQKLMLNLHQETSATIEYKLDDIVRSGLAKEILIADHGIE